MVSSRISFKSSCLDIFPPISGHFTHPLYYCLFFVLSNLTSQIILHNPININWSVCTFLHENDLKIIFVVKTMNTSKITFLIVLSVIISIYHIFISCIFNKQIFFAFAVAISFSNLALSAERFADNSSRFAFLSMNISSLK